MNETTMKLIHWIWSEPELASFLREIAKGEPVPPHDEIYEYGDEQLACWISDLVFPEGRSRGILAWERMVSRGASNAKVDALYEELTAGRKTPAGRLEWLSEMNTELIRTALVGSDAGGPHIYVHATVKGFHPNNRYRVHSPNTVYESGWTSGSGAWTLAEPDRQVCPEPITSPCSCKVEQR